MWETFKRLAGASSQPRVSVSARGLSLNKAAASLLFDNLPGSGMDLVALLDEESGLVGLRLPGEGEERDTFIARRPRSGKRLPHGKRKYKNKWFLH